MQSRQQPSNRREQSLPRLWRQRRLQPSERNHNEGLERVKSILVPAKVSSQIPKAEEAIDQPKPPATGSTKPPTRASNTLAFVTRNARRRMRVTLCSQLIRRSSAAR